MRVLVVEDEPYMAEAIRDGLRLEAIAADIAGDGDTALGLLSVNAYDIAVLDRDIPGPVTRSPNASSPPAAAHRSSCSRPPIASTTKPPGSSSAPTIT
jgi:CheY-like chemotaxis protein